MKPIINTGRQKTEKNSVRYILFGAGKCGIDALHFLGGKDKVTYFCDNMLHKEGAEIDGVPIIDPKRLRNLISDDTKVVITTDKSKNIYEMSSQLKEMNIEYVLFEELARSVIENEEEIYSKANKRAEFEINKNRDYLIWRDRYETAGQTGSYFWQDLWAAKKIHANPVALHYDIGSRLDGFIAHLLSYGQRVAMIDIRPLDISIGGLDFIKADATELESLEDDSVESLSALCSLEHFGLGRYGDPIDPEACFKCFSAIQRKMKAGGNLYLSVPIGKECVCFNAHRVFSIETIIREFSEMEVIEVSACFQDEYEENLSDYHKYDDWYDREGDRMGLFWLKKRNKENK